jgi:hypothetical protein
MRELVGRLPSFRTGYLALLELRLEATRRPGLHAVLTERVRADLDAGVAHHEASGLPGDAMAVRLLYLALSWLIVEQLTLPDVLTETERDELVAAAVERIVADPGSRSGGPAVCSSRVLRQVREPGRLRRAVSSAA